MSADVIYLEGDILFANEAEILSLFETDRIDTALDALAASGKVACAGVLAGHAMGLGWQDAGHLGSLCAAEVISHYGARPEQSIHELAQKI